jgi:hypothetical protein
VAGAKDLDYIRAALAIELGRNSYLHGCPPDTAGIVASRILSGFPDSWSCDVIAPAEDPDVPCGWVIYERIPTLTVLFAFVSPQFRGFGAWRQLAKHIGLEPRRHVAIVLGSPSACGIARDHYAVKHNWGRVLEWLT